MVQLVAWPGCGVRAVLREVRRRLGGVAVDPMDPATSDALRSRRAEHPEEETYVLGEVVAGCDLRPLLEAVPASSLIVVASREQLAVPARRLVRIEAEELLLEPAERAALGAHLGCDDPAAVEEWSAWTGGWLEPLALALQSTDRSKVLSSLEAIFDSLPRVERDLLGQLAFALSDAGWLPWAIIGQGRQPPSLCGCEVSRERAEIRLVPAWHEVVRARLSRQWPSQRREAAARRGAWLSATAAAAPAARSAEAAAPEVYPGSFSGLGGAGFRVLLLGKPTLLAGAPDRELRRVEWPRRAAMVLFLFLVTRPERRADRDEVIEAVWWDADRSTARHRLHPAVSQLRAALRNRQNTEPTVLFRDGAYELSPAIEWQVDSEVQVTRSEDAKRHTEAGRVVEATAAWEDVLALSRGPFAAGVERPWVEIEREAARRRQLEATRQLANLRARLGDTSSAVAGYLSMVREEPLDETLHVELMRLHCGEGRRDLVHQRYAELCQLLSAEVGAEPLPATTAAYRDLLARLG